MVTVGVMLPGEALVVAGLDVLGKIVDKQPPEVAAEMWRRWLEWTAPFHAIAVQTAERMVKDASK